MRRTHYVKRTITIITTTHYTISWEASPASADPVPGPAPEPGVIVLPNKELTKTIEEKELTTHHNPDSDQPTSSFQPGEPS